MELLYPEATCHLIPLAERCQQEMAIYLQTLLVGFTVASQWETDAGQGRPLVCLAGICSCSVESILSALSYPFIFFYPTLPAWSSKQYSWFPPSQFFPHKKCMKFIKLRKRQTDRVARVYPVSFIAAWEFVT